jgi:hypothetical protein
VVEGRQLHQLHTPDIQEGSGSNEKGVRPLPFAPCKTFLDLTSSVRLEHLQLQADRASCRLYVP